MYSKSAMEKRQWRRFGIFLVSFEYISHFILAFLFITLSMYSFAGQKDALRINYVMFSRFNNRSTDVYTIEEGRGFNMHVKSNTNTPFKN